MTTASQILAVASKEVGTKEGRDPGGNWNNRVKYNNWYANHPSIKNNAFLTTAWCAVFVSWCAGQIGVLGKLIPMHAWTPSGLSWFQSRGLVTKGGGAKPGDVFYVYYPSQGRVAHTGLVERVDGSYIYTIEGNTNTTGSRQGNGVYRLRRKINPNLYFCHPRYDKTSSGAASPGIGVGKPSSGKPTISLSGLHNAISKDLRKQSLTTTNWGSVYPVEAALQNEGFLSPTRVDGRWDLDAAAAYKRWQRTDAGGGYTGRDADGVPPKALDPNGNDSLSRLAKRHGFGIIK